ncbi:MAG: 4-hydroxy-tetrahydrodipicolinate synthase [Bacteroidales bacterium]|nr:4-hydroxy-tetrahydrodipicolinate synthase [Bacteroidales bacterium]
MLANKFIGTGVPTITPFKTDGSVDLEALGRLINHIIDGGIDYIVALGTTSEICTLSKVEQDAIVKKTVETVRGRVPIVVGIGGNNTAECVEILKTYDFTGIDGILSVVPYYNKPTQEGIYLHFSAIAKACPVPIILYNIPPRCVVNMDVETTIRLANDHPNIIALKDSSNDMEHCQKIIQHKGKPNDFLVISGDDGTALELIEMGGVGVISVMANALPVQVSSMIRAGVSGDFEKAKKEFSEYQHLVPFLFEEGNPTGAKSIISLLGFCEDTLRLPLVKSTNSLKSRIQTAFEPFVKG